MIPTAEELTNELVKKHYPLYGKYLCEDEKQWIAELAIEFARLHVKAALDAADAEVPLHCSHGVLNAYPPENIT